VIDGIDWVIAHKAQYNIRIINLSLGHEVTEPSATDPLCQAVARAYAAGLVVVAAAYFYTNVSRTLLFWSAFILTRPLGATAGDLLDKPVANGGLAFGRFYASAILAILIVACIVLLPQRAGKHPETAQEI